MINFTKDHENRLKELACEMLFNNGVIQTKLGQPLDIVALLHTTTINTLNEIKNKFSNTISKMEEADEWVEKDSSKIEKQRKAKELVNLIIGWKRFNLEKAENARKREELSAKLAELKESQKTPEDRIKEMEAELASLDENFQ